MANNRGNQSDKVVGIFLDESHAQRAIQALQSAGYKAQIADQSAINAFRNSGFEDEIVQLYKSRYDEGNSIVTVQSGNRGEDALGVMLENGAEYINLSSQGAMQGQQGAGYYRNLNQNQREYGQIDQNTGRRADAEQTRLQLREETLTANKQAVQTGEVGLRKVVHERQQEVPVNLTREEVYVERHAVDRPVAPGEINDMQDETIRVPVYEEQAQLQKQARVTEEVSLGKQAVQEQKTLTGTTRHEHAEIIQDGDVKVTGDTGTTIDENMRNTGNQADRSNYNQ